MAISPLEMFSQESKISTARVSLMSKEESTGIGSGAPIWTLLRYVSLLHHLPYIGKKKTNVQIL